MGDGMIKSTREEKKVSASYAILNGLASDGGLYIFDEYPTVDIDKIFDFSYQELAAYILDLLLDDYSYDEIKDVIDKAYDSKFDNESTLAFKTIKNCTVLELFHGPTLAFKDMALSVLPGLLALAKKKNNVSDKTIILTATSGDTGGATLSGFSSREDMNLIVFYPNNGVSRLQERQMLSFASDRCHVIAYDGNFDDTQNFVKEMFKKHKYLSSSNSINIGRLVPQIVYYFYSYVHMIKTNQIKKGEEINICVPTGNFGNILAAYIAYLMGLKVKNFICASNKNNVLTEFFETGVYNKNREFFKTNSPSMDILISSNLERLLYLFGGSTSDLMKSLNDTGTYKVSDDVFEKMKIFKSGYMTEEETVLKIKEVFEKENYLMDPHTAVAYGVYQKLNDDTKTLVVSTASPYKFTDTIKEALSIECDDDLLFEEISKRTNTIIPKVISTYKMNKKNVWLKEDVYENFEKLIKELGYDKD